MKSKTCPWTCLTKGVLDFFFFFKTALTITPQIKITQLRLKKHGSVLTPTRLPTSPNPPRFGTNVPDASHSRCGPSQYLWPLFKHALSLTWLTGLWEYFYGLVPTVWWGIRLISLAVARRLSRRREDEPRELTAGENPAVLSLTFKRGGEIKVRRDACVSS